MFRNPMTGLGLTENLYIMILTNLTFIHGKVEYKRGRVCYLPKSKSLVLSLCHSSFKRSRGMRNKDGFLRPVGITKDPNSGKPDGRMMRVL